VLRRLLLIGSAQLEIRYRTVPVPCPCTISLLLFRNFLGVEALTASSSLFYSTLKYSNSALYYAIFLTIYCPLNALFLSVSIAGQLPVVSKKNISVTSTLIAEEEWQASALVRVKRDGFSLSLQYLYDKLYLIWYLVILRLVRG